MIRLLVSHTYNVYNNEKKNKKREKIVCVLLAQAGLAPLAFVSWAMDKFSFYKFFLNIKKLSFFTNKEWRIHGSHYGAIWQK